MLQIRIFFLAYVNSVFSYYCAKVDIKCLLLKFCSAFEFCAMRESIPSIPDKNNNIKRKIFIQ
jgi:hypothetical protein